jgi:uncharacterized protein YecT (DUF1311 family)
MKHFLIASMLLTSSLCFSQHDEKKDKIDIEEEACLKKKEINNSGMTNCLSEAYVKWDKKLNATYKSLLGKLPATAKAKLITAQKAWVKFKKTEFELIRSTYASAGGTMWRPIAMDKVKELTKQRVLVLEELLQTLPDMYLKD